MCPGSGDVMRVRAIAVDFGSAPTKARDKVSRGSELGTLGVDSRGGRSPVASQRPASDLRGRSGTAGHEKRRNGRRLGPAGPRPCQVETIVGRRRSAHRVGQLAAAAKPTPAGEVGEMSRPRHEVGDGRQAVADRCSRRG